MASSDRGEAGKEKKPAAREKLEVPLLSPLERRLNVMGTGPEGSQAEKPNIGRVGRSAVLGRLQQFLPAMEAANASLQQEMQGKPAEAFDIEHVEDEAKEPYIEMDLACGVLDLLNEDAVAAAERAMQEHGPDFVLPGVGGGDSDDSSSDSDSSDNTDASEEVDGVQGHNDVQGDLEMQLAGAAADQGAQAAGSSGQQTQEQQPTRAKLRAKRTSQKIQELT